MLALDEVHAAFGVSEAELQQVVQNGIIHFDPRVDVSPFGRLLSLVELGERKRSGADTLVWVWFYCSRSSRMETSTSSRSGRV